MCIYGHMWFVMNLKHTQYILNKHFTHFFYLAHVTFYLKKKKQTFYSFLLGSILGSASPPTTPTK